MTPAFYSLAADAITDEQMQPSNLVDPAAFTSDDHEEHILPIYHSDDGAIVSGIWECDPCLQEVPAYPVNEMMTIISGSLTLTDAEGSSKAYGPGDSLFIARGATFTWHNAEKLKKYFMSCG